ncbi:MAG: sodium/calcium exchanger protein [Sandaracinaceae bacterium]
MTGGRGRDDEEAERMAGGGGGGGSTWIVTLVGGAVLCGAGYATEAGLEGPAWVGALLLGLGGLAVIFGSCEAMILSVEGVGARLGWNAFVAGTMAGLASNIPEIVMLAFVVLAEPRVAFIVVTLTLHVNALMFGVYSGLLPRDARGLARLPEPLVRISTDLYAAGGGVFLATGGLMVVMHLFPIGDHDGEGLGIVDLYALGLTLLAVQVVATSQLVRRFAGSAPGAEVPTAEQVGAERAGAERADAPSWGLIALYGALGIGSSLLGGHAVGDFAEWLVGGLRAQGYPEMVGALVLSLFAGAGAYVMVATAHVKGMYDIALANVSGSITQVPFLVLPAVAILLAVFAGLGWIPVAPSGAVLPIDLETTSVVLLAFPPMLILWKSVQDDGTVNWVETAGMVAVFGLTVYFLAQHG